MQARVGGQDPFHHFRVRSRGKIGAAKGKACGHALGGRDRFQPGSIFFECAEESFQPPVAITVLERSWPDAELFHVVAESGYSPRMLLCRAAKIRDGFFYLSKRDKVAQFLQARE